MVKYLYHNSKFGMVGKLLRKSNIDIIYDCRQTTKVKSTAKDLLNRLIHTY
jgi:hypothetical protein